MGAFEASAYPGALMLLMSWYTPREIALRIGFYHSCQSSKYGPSYLLYTICRSLTVFSSRLNDVRCSRYSYIQRPERGSGYGRLEVDVCESYKTAGVYDLADPNRSLKVSSPLSGLCSV